MGHNNIYMYWIGREYSLLNILRSLIKLHSTSGSGYNIHIINHDNIKSYVTVLPECFYSLVPAHQADYVRVNVLCDRGGIWMDADTIVMESLDPLFAILDTKDGFFIKENNLMLWNGVFGSRANTPLMLEWKSMINNILKTKGANIAWMDIGHNCLANIHKQYIDYYNNYTVFNGLDMVYPVDWKVCVQEFIEKPYENYKTLIRDFQPFIVLVNSVYKALDKYSEKDILDMNMPLNYFINKSIETKGICYKYKLNMETNSESLNRKAIFETIYEKNIWNDADPSIPLSGPGSSLKNTKDVSNLLTSFIYENKCKSVVDLGCGDLTWISKTTFFNDDMISYTGIDIAEPLIRKHSMAYPKNRFLNKDIVCSNDIDHSSIIIIRDVIFHLSLQDVQSIFRNIRGKFDYIAITSCNNVINKDSFNQFHFSERNLFKEPFSVSTNYITFCNEPVFNRKFCIYSHDNFYNVADL